MFFKKGDLVRLTYNENDLPPGHPALRLFGLVVVDPGHGSLVEVCWLKGYPNNKTLAHRSRITKVE
jgi:hypothetical protein